MVNLIASLTHKPRFCEVVKYPQKYGHIYLHFWGDSKLGHWAISSYWDKDLLSRAWNDRWDQRLFTSEEQFLKCYYRAKKKSEVESTLKRVLNFEEL